MLASSTSTSELLISLYFSDSTTLSSKYSTFFFYLLLVYFSIVIFFRSSIYLLSFSIYWDCSVTFKLKFSFWFLICSFYSFKLQNFPYNLLFYSDKIGHFLHGYWGLIVSFFSYIFVRCNSLSFSLLYWSSFCRLLIYRLCFLSRSFFLEIIEFIFVCKLLISSSLAFIWLFIIFIWSLEY